MRQSGGLSWIYKGKNYRLNRVHSDTVHLKNNQEITWLDFEKGYAKAKKENKILLVDVYTDWCYWCKVMDKKTYANDTVKSMLNQYFVTVKMNPEVQRKYAMDKDSVSSGQLYSWLGYGKRFGYPTAYFVVNVGKTNDRYAVIGYSQSWDFRNIMQQVRNKVSH
jgi:thioredoxin-related protein